MKHILSFATIALALEAAAATGVTLSLKDGSTLRAELKTEKIACSTVFAKALGLNAAIVKTIAFTGKEGEAKVELVNGDTLTASIDNPSFKVSSMLGELDIPKEKIRKIALSPAKELLFADNGLVFHCTFDDEASITSPAAGPGGKLATGKFVEGKVGGAVYVPKGGSAGYFTLPQGTFGEEGCIEFWARLETTKPYFRDCDPRMIFIRSPAGCFTVEYSSNNGAGRGGFCVRCLGYSYIYDGRLGGRFGYETVVGKDINAWHHYAFSWTKSKMTAFIDGKPIDLIKYEGDVLNGEKLKAASFEMGLPNANDILSNTEPNTPFVLDELKIWNWAKTDFSL